VDQSSTNLGETAPSAPTALCATAPATKVLGSNSQDQNAPNEPAVGTSAALPKKLGPVATKAPVDKKKVDARKKSLKRL
jgi:ubiquitin-conjugating enzyme E2 S